ncbi:hypothetical protein ACJJTC_007614 [Scirpophaga incertulas]
MGPSSVTTEDNNTDKTNGDQFFQAVVQSLKENSVRNQLSVYITKRKIHQYKKEGNNINSADDFIDYCSNKMTIEKCHKAVEATVCQASSPLWHELRAEVAIVAIVATRKVVIENGGFFLKPDWPHLGASPDGLTKKSTHFWKAFAFSKLIET